tara:strand:+ start:5226 stop:6761 length:1536 start_codon:yes stop_codon:yes gene_type:complete
LETELATYEDSLFLNLSTRDSSLPIANTTNEPGITNNETARLRGNDLARQIGPGKLLEVNRDDVVDMEANAYHTGSYTDNGSNLGSYVATLVGMITSTAPIGNEGSIIQNSVNNNSSLIFVGANGDTNAPRAYLNYILFDQDFNYLDASFKQVGSATNTYHSLTRSKTIPEKGYIYVYVSNESNNSFDVYFDDLRITHTKGKVIQEDHYYPFGANISALSSTAPLSKPNQFKYNGKEIDDEFDLNLYNYGKRQYDPVIGRWTGVDALAEEYDAWSPYHYVYNNPVKLFDPDGREIINGAKQGTKEYESTQNALSILKKTNPEAYSTLHNSSTKYVINYAQLNPDEAYQSGFVGERKDGDTGVTFSVKNGLDATNIITDENGDVSGADLQRRLTFDEQEAMRDEGKDPTGEKKKISQKEAAGFVTISGGVEIRLDNRLLKAGEKELTSILGHEFGHAAFAESNTILAYLWSLIGSAGGHDANNPSGKKADEEESKARKGYKKAKKELKDEEN